MIYKAWHGMHLAIPTAPISSHTTLQPAASLCSFAETIMYQGLYIHFLLWQEPTCNPSLSF